MRYLVVVFGRVSMRQLSTISGNLNTQHSVYGGFNCTPQSVYLTNLLETGSGTTFEGETRE